MSIFGRYIQHAAVATTGRTALVDDGLPLGAGRMAILANNCQHLAEQNPLRALRQHPGVPAGFWAPAVSGTSFTDPPDVEDIRWALTPKDGCCAIDLGTHYVWKLPSGAWPKVRLTFSAKVEGGYTLGWLFAVSAGNLGPLGATLVDNGGATITSSSWNTYEASFSLTDAELRMADYTPTNGVDEASTSEAGGLRTFRAFFGAFNSSNLNGGGSLAFVAGLALRLEAP